MAESRYEELGSGAITGWCASALTGAAAVATRLPAAPAGAHGRHAERALALRMGILAQKAPPYRALRALRPLASGGWADGMARRYPTHADLTPPFQAKAADLRPTARGWIDTTPGRRLTAPAPDTHGPGPLGDVLTELIDRVLRYVTKYSKNGVLGQAETGLARICLMLARIEAGHLPEPGMTAEQIYRSVPEPDVHDLAGLVRRLDAAGVVPKRGGRASGVAEPVFIHEVAEGDLILGNTLIAVCLGDRTEMAGRLQRLVTHAWLDVDDLYRIRNVGVYVADPGTLISAPVAELAGLITTTGADIARAEFLALAGQEITVPRPVAAADAANAAWTEHPPKKETGRALPDGTVYGPEKWDTVAGADWTYWDLWMSVVAIADHGGDWDALDRSWNGRLLGSTWWVEPFWQHLVDLRARLSASGITAADLVGDLAGHRATLKKARAKVTERTGVSERDLSPAMRDLPSDRFEARAHFGHWDRHPVSPRPFYERLSAATPLDLSERGWGGTPWEDIVPLLDELEKLEKEHVDDPATLLAVRRAGLTACSQAAHRYNDSYGELGDRTREVLRRFTRTDWRASGIEPAVFWRDVLEILILLDRFGAVYDQRAEVMIDLGAAADRDLIGQIVDDLHASYLAGRLDYAARDVRQLGEAF